MATNPNNEDVNSTHYKIFNMLKKGQIKAFTFVRYAWLAVNIDNNVIVICQSNAIPFVFLKMTIIFFVTYFLKWNTFLTQRTIKLVFTASKSKER